METLALAVGALLGGLALGIVIGWVVGSQSWRIKYNTFLASGMGIRQQYHTKIDAYKNKILDSYRAGNVRNTLNDREITELINYGDQFCREMKAI